MRNISSLKTYFDEIEETNGDDECRAWLQGVSTPRLSWPHLLPPAGEEAKPQRPDALIRFPKPGHTATALRDEKVTNEVLAMEHLRQNTTIPIPRVYSWGLTAESPQQFGPFIIMDFVQGTLLSTVLKKPMEGDQGDVVLNPGIDNSILTVVYRQIAD